MSSISLSTSQPGPPDPSLRIEELFAAIKKLTERKDFIGAEKLRDTLLETSPMALQEIIDSAEIIEKAKYSNIDQAHLALWDDLYNELSVGEKNTIFYSMQKIKVPAKKKILSKGQFNNRLFFIEDGKLAVYKQKEGKNELVAQLGRGNILGEYTFTTISLCSANVLSQSEVTLYSLKNSATDEWEEKHPGLLQKLTKFCDKRGNLSEIDRRRKQEKWKYPRYKTQGIVTANLLDKEGQKTDRFFHGKLLDLSRDGASFGVEIQNRKTARALLTKHIRLTFSCMAGNDTISFYASGRVVRVSYHLYSSYTVHIRFDTFAEENLIETLAAGKEQQQKKA